MALPKWGEPQGQWTQQRAHAGTVTNAFGVVDQDGAAIPGLQVEFLLFRGGRIVHERLTFTLRQLDFGRLVRVYQQEINRRPGLRPTDHAYSHEHIGDVRVVADPAWSDHSVALAVERFCQSCNLTLHESLPDLDAFELR